MTRPEVQVSGASAQARLTPALRAETANAPAALRTLLAGPPAWRGGGGEADMK
jgi:hypothetical protein